MPSALEDLHKHRLDRKGWLAMEFKDWSINLEAQDLDNSELLTLEWGRHDASLQHLLPSEHNLSMVPTPAQQAEIDMHNAQIAATNAAVQRQQQIALQHHAMMMQAQQMMLMGGAVPLVALPAAPLPETSGQAIMPPNVEEACARPKQTVPVIEEPQTSDESEVVPDEPADDSKAGQKTDKKRVSSLM